MHSAIRYTRSLLTAGFLLGALIWSVAPAHAGVQIFKSFATDVLKQKFEISAGDYKVISLPTAEPGDVFFVQVTLQSNIFKDVSAFIVDETGYEKLKKKLPYEMQRSGMKPKTVWAIRPWGFQEVSNKGSALRVLWLSILKLY